MNFELFTDFNISHSPQYFYVRGAIWGIVFTTCFYKFFLPWLKKKIFAWKKYRQILDRS